MRLGLIAGNGRFPFLIVEAARQLGRPVSVVAVKGEASPELEEEVKKSGGSLEWVALGQLGSAIKFLKREGVTEALMAGQVKHVKIFDVVPDMTMMSVILKLPARNTDALIAAVAEVLKDHGITLTDSTALLAPMLAAPNWRALTITEVNPDHAPDEAATFGDLIEMLAGHLRA
jgi:hypothetical protein